MDQYANFALDQAELQQRMAMWHARIEAHAQEREVQRRANRIAGRVPHAVRDGLRGCTVVQLRNAKRLCDQYIWDQQHPPTDDECSDERPFILRVLLSIPFRKERYRYEIARSTLKADRVYVNGPYWYRYERNGRIVFRRQIRKKNIHEMPRKVKTELKKYSSSHNVAGILDETREKFFRIIADRNRSLSE